MPPTVPVPPAPPTVPDPPVPGPPRPRRAEQLVADLLQQVEQGVVRPGARLPTESALMATYGVSRTVVREAISRLQASGIVRTHQGRGSFVLAIPGPREFAVGEAGEGSATDVLRILEFRTAVEVESAGLAAARRTPAQLAAAGRALAGLEAGAGHPSEAVAADFAFHLAVAWATGNPHFPALLETLGPGMLAIPRDRLLARPEHAALVHAEHADIHSAIGAGDVLGARAAMRLHLTRSARRLHPGG